jgi:signal peptidase I
MNRALRFTLLGLAVVVAGCGSDTKTYIYRSSAMEPTIHCAGPRDGCKADTADTLVVESFDGSPERGDIVLLKPSHSAKRKCVPGEFYVKRVIALPGETWAMRDGYVYVDDQRLAEAYVTADRRDQSTHPSRRVPEDMYVVMGDNRSHSCDSRVFGAIPRASITGRVAKIERAG